MRPYLIIQYQVIIPKEICIQATQIYSEVIYIYIHTCVAHVTIILRQRKDHKSETKRTAMGLEWIRERKMKEKIYNL